MPSESVARPDRHVTRRPPRTADATLLTVFVTMLLAIPAPMVFAPLGTAGSPATIIAMSSTCLWLWYQIQRDHPVTSGVQPVRAAMIGWLLAMLAVYAHAMAHPISADEISPADSGLLRLIGMTGIVLVANDGIRSLARHRQLVGSLVIAVGMVALLGVIQTITKQLWVDRISIPGLRSGAAGWELAARSGLVRPSGTSTHPIEFGMVLTTTLPLAMTLARSASRRRWLYRVLLIAISISILLSISRSAMICAAVAFVVTVSSWPLAAKVWATASALLVTTVVFLTMPGVLGTITNLFTGISSDSSVASRTGSYDVASMFISRSPLLGRGFGTFLPKYWILDNGYLGLLIEGGALGLLGLLIVIATAVGCAFRSARIHVHTAERGQLDREIAAALVAAVAAGAVGLAFFDTFAFPQSEGVFFLLIGLAGASWRLSSGERRRLNSPNEAPSRSSVTEANA